MALLDDSRRLLVGLLSVCCRAGVPFRSAHTLILQIKQRRMDMSKKQLLVPTIIAIAAMSPYLMRSDASSNLSHSAQQFDCCGFRSACCDQADARSPTSSVGCEEAAECGGADCCGAECCGAECCSAECCSAECCSAECCSAECCSADGCSADGCSADGCSADVPCCQESECPILTECCDGLATCCESSAACCTR